MITAEDIRRSAAIKLPQPPNLQLASVNVGQHAIIARGCSNAIDYKRMDLIDGRTICSSLSATCSGTPST